MAVRKRRAASCAPGPSSAKARVMRCGLQAGELERQRLALRRHEQQPLAAVLRALLLHHVALIDQLLEHAAERLLGDVQDVEQVGDLHARIAVDEMQHAVMRAAEAELAQHLVRIADEVAIGEEQQLDDVPDRLLRRRRWRGGRSARLGGACAHIYVSHVDIFWFYVTKTRCQNERIVPKRLPLLRRVRSGSDLVIPGVARRRKVLEWTRKMRHYRRQTKRRAA